MLAVGYIKIYMHPCYEYFFSLSRLSQLSAECRLFSPSVIRPVVHKDMTPNTSGLRLCTLYICNVLCPSFLGSILYF